MPFTLLLLARIRMSCRGVLGHQHVGWDQCMECCSTVAHAPT